MRVGKLSRGIEKFSGSRVAIFFVDGVLIFFHDGLGFFGRG